MGAIDCGSDQLDGNAGCPTEGENTIYRLRIWPGTRIARAELSLAVGLVCLLVAIGGSSTTAIIYVAIVPTVMFLSMEGSARAERVELLATSLRLSHFRAPSLDIPYASILDVSREDRRVVVRYREASIIGEGAGERRLELPAIDPDGLVDALHLQTGNAVGSADANSYFSPVRADSRWKPLIRYFAIVVVIGVGLSILRSFI